MKKGVSNFRRFVCEILVFALVISSGGVSITAQAEKFTDSGGIIYEISNDSAIITGFDREREIVEIPAEIDGYPVSSYESRAFWSSAYKTKKFVVDEDNMYFSSDELGVLFDKDKTKIIKYPAASTATEYATPQSVTLIGYCAFNHCDNIERIILGENVTEISQEAFYQCKNLADINFPEGLTRISKEAFSSCEKLSSVVLPESLIEIGQRAFVNTSIESFNISENVKTIYEPGQALATKKLVWIEVDEANQKYSSDENGILYNKDKTILYKYPDALENESFTVPYGVLSIGVYALSSDNLKEIFLPDSVVSFYSDAFTSCGIERIEIPNSVKSISDSAFLYCRNLKEIILPSSIEKINYGAFRECDSLSDVYYGGTEEEWNAIEIASDNEKLTDATIHYNFGKESGSCGENATYSYDADSKTLTISGEGDMFSFDDASEYGWYSFKDEAEVILINSKVTSVGANAFNGFSALKEVVLSNTVTYIGEKAFAGCDKLSIVSSTASKFELVGNPFEGCNERLIIFSYSSNFDLIDFTQNNSIKYVAVSHDKENKTIRFNSELTVYSDLSYKCLSKFLANSNDTEYIFFSKLVFYGVEPEIVDGDILENEPTAQYLTFNKLYVSLKAVKDGISEDISFEQLLTLLESGEYDAFMFELSSDEGDQVITFEEKFQQIINNFIEDALRVTSKIINFFRKLFK